ncbi:MAG TPA: response regulator transcription factor [Candidatus Kapabacteria bacterium]|nr:response regulator transcription factor [Candidatus Kapabacteria bacterium]
MNRSVYIYAVSMAILLIVLKTIEYKYLIYDIKIEYYVAIIAALFTVLGLWIGWKITGKNRAVVQTQAVMAPALVPASDLGISPREVEVLKLIAAGHSNQEIADTLFLSLNTVKKHTSSIFRKLETERRTQAIEKARRFGLID